MAALPPHLSPITLSNAGREYEVTATDDGKILYFGNACDGRVGTYVIQFVPDENWTGSFGVLARAYGSPASDNGVAFQSIPYRRVSLNGMASDRALSADPLASSFIIEVPANGLAIGLLVGVCGGGGVLYSWPLNGPAT